MLKYLLAPVVVALGLLAACATTAPTVAYKQALKPEDVGYSDAQVAGNRYTVSFTAPKEAGRQYAEAMALRRAQEIARAKGAGWFRVASRQTAGMTVRGRKVGVISSTSGNLQCGGLILGCSYDSRDDSIAGAKVGVVDSEVTRIIAVMEIVLGEGPKPQGDTSVYDAQ